MSGEKKRSPFTFSRFFRAGDGVILCLAALVTAGAFFRAIRADGGEPSLVIESDFGVEIVPLARKTAVSGTADAQNIPVRGPLGETLLEVRDGSVRVISSPCKNKLCVASGAIHTSGAVLACLPNRVVARIAGKKAPIDALSW